jgi:hypothetical protein
MRSRRPPRVLACAFLALLSLACGGSEAIAPSPDAAAGVDAPVNCASTSQSNLSGAHITIDSSRCVFTLAEAAAGITIAYDVVIDAAIPGIVSNAQDDSHCGTADASGLIPFASVSGAGQRYCMCDVGLCPARSPSPVTLVAGRYAHSFQWDGRNWTGPSDTSRPEGAPFPAGTYTLTVSAVGSQPADGASAPFSVMGTLPITLVP